MKPFTRFWPWAIAIIIATAFLSACNEGANPNPLQNEENDTTQVGDTTLVEDTTGAKDTMNVDDPELPDPKLLTFKSNYWIAGDTIYTVRETKESTDKYCEGDSLVIETEPAGIDTSTTIYRIEGDTLKFLDFDEEEEGSDTSAFKWVKITGGSGLSGRWKLAYNLDDSSLTEAEKTFAREIYSNIQLEFNNNNLNIYGFNLGELSFSFQPFGWLIGWTITGWLYDVELVEKPEIISPTKAVLKGRQSGEIVTITWDQDGNATYSSSNPDNNTKVVYAEPETCPNDSPDWYSVFLGDNPIVQSAD